MAKITRIHAREVLDSRGKPTVEAEVHLEGRIVGRAIVPSGASTGTAEACELRDGDPARYDGLGVRKAVENVASVIQPALLGMDAADQRAVDGRMMDLDGTSSKSRLGANAILAVSLAAARAAALALQVPLYRHLNDLLNRHAASPLTAHHPPLAYPSPHRSPALTAIPRLPIPMTNLISGGQHAGRNLDIQDVLIIPLGALDYPTGLEWIVRVYRRLGKLLGDAGCEGRLVGDEGGFGPRLESNRQAIELVMRAIEAAGLWPGRDMTIALDVAATQFYRDGSYVLAAESGSRLTSGDMIERLEYWISTFPITSIEDGLAESDWSGWQKLTERLGRRVMLVGDDLFATNAQLLDRGINEKVANAILIKVNQIGTLTETFEAILLAKRHGYTCVVSARSGETEDDFLADLAVGAAADYIKIGSVARSERLAKYNRLLRISEERI